MSEILAQAFADTDRIATLLKSARDVYYGPAEDRLAAEHHVRTIAEQLTGYDPESASMLAYAALDFGMRQVPAPVLALVTNSTNATAHLLRTYMVSALVTGITHTQAMRTARALADRDSDLDADQIYTGTLALARRKLGSEVLEASGGTLQLRPSETPYVLRTGDGRWYASRLNSSSGWAIDDMGVEDESDIPANHVREMAAVRRTYLFDLEGCQAHILRVG